MTHQQLGIVRRWYRTVPADPVLWVLVFFQMMLLEAVLVKTIGTTSAADAGGIQTLFTLLIWVLIIYAFAIPAMQAAIKESEIERLRQSGGDG